MNILISKLTDSVEGINIPSTPFNYYIEVEDNFNLTKTIVEEEGEVQKTTELGEPVYVKEVYRTDVHEVVIGRDEVLEDTGVPVIICTQKTDSNGNKLYLESLYEDGVIVDKTEVTEEYDESGTRNEPIMIEVHKTSVGGRPLYYKDVIKEESVRVLDHVEETTESKIPTKFEEISVLQKVIVGTEVVVDEVTKEETTVFIYEDRLVTDKVPVEWEELSPVMIPNLITKVVNFKNEYKYFSAEDILVAKYQSLLDSSQYDYVLGDMFLNELDIDINDSNHSANTGVALLELLPRGQAKTLSINLEAPSKEFKLLDFDCDEGVEAYLSGKKFVNESLSLSSPISNCTIKFVNTTDKPRVVRSYAIGY